MNPSEPATLSSGQLRIVISVSLTSFMCLLDAYIVNISLPEIARHFSVTAGEVVRINLAFLLVLTSGLSIWGKLADRLGLKRVFLGGYLVFIFSLVVCGFSPSLFWLIVGRSLQGLGTSMLIVSSPAFIASYIPANRQGMSYGLQATAGSLGLIAGAPLGGIISGYLGWHYIFLVNIPIGIAAAFLAYKALPADPSVDDVCREKFDVVGAILLVSGLVLLVIGINRGHSNDWQSLNHWLQPLAGLAILAVLAFWEKQAVSPLIPLEVLTNRIFVLMTLAFVAVLMVLSGNNFVVPFYLTRELNLSQAGSGLLMLTFSITYGLLSLFMGRRADRFNPALLCVTGMILACASLFFFTAVLEKTSIILTALFLIGIGCSFGCFIAPATKMVMATADKNNAASVAALNRTSIYLASLVGVSLFDLLLGGNGGKLETGDFQRVYLVALIMPIMGLFFSWQAMHFSKKGI